MTPAWTRRKNETTRAYAAFLTYRDAGPQRSIRKTAAATGKGAANLRLLEGWSSQHDWVARAAAWDAHLDAKQQRAYEETAEEIGRRQARLGRDMQAKAQEALGHLEARYLAGSDVARLAKVGADLERIGAGLPTGRTEVTGVGGGPVQVTDPIANAVARDPAAREAALRLLKAAGEAPKDPGGAAP